MSWIFFSFFRISDPGKWLYCPLPPLSLSGSSPLRGPREGKMKAPALHFSLTAKAVKKIPKTFCWPKRNTCEFIFQT
jgi:hypothetical protein